MVDVGEQFFIAVSEIQAVFGRTNECGFNSPGFHSHSY